MRTGLLFALVMSASFPVWAAVPGQTVEYRDGDTVLEGYLAYDDAAAGKRPAVIVVHEWKGLEDYSRMRADMLAREGFVVLAADMYGKGVRAKDHEEAAKISGIYRNDRNLMRQRAKAALDFLKAQPQVDPSKIAAIGYCFGGTTVLEMARAGFDLKGVASFHGGLSTSVPAEAGAVKARVQVYHGAEDKYVPAVDVLAFQEEMQKAGADWSFTSFGGAVHSFTVRGAGTDPSTGMAYHEKADQRSWIMLLQFLKEIFA